MDSRERWPASVYGTGTEPDPRFSLANERTFLAWIRTTLALLGVAVALDIVRLPLPPHVQQVMTGVLALCGAGTAVQAWRGWARTERAMREKQPLPGATMSFPLMVAMVLLAGTLMVAVLGPWR